MAQSNKNPEKDFNKIYNGQVPRSQANSGTELDSFCPEIETASAGMDDDPTEFTESNGEIGEAISAATYLPNAMAEGGEEAEKAAGGMMMESDGRKKRGGKDTTM